MNDTASLLDDYRARLRRASAQLPPDVRDELLDDVEAHLAELRAASPSTAATRDALDRLGPPEEVAAAAERELGSGAAPAAAPSAWSPPPAPATRMRALDVIAVVLLLLGGVFPPLLGWVVGVVLLWASATWTTREKLLGTLVFPFGLAGPLYLTLFAGGQTCSSTEVRDAVGDVAVIESCSGFAFPVWIGIPLVVALVVAPIVVATVLLRRANARAARRGASADAPR